MNRALLDRDLLEYVSQNSTIHHKVLFSTKACQPGLVFRSSLLILKDQSLVGPVYRICKCQLLNLVYQDSLFPKVTAHFKLTYTSI